MYFSFMLKMDTERLLDRIGGLMVSVLALSTVDRWFEPRSGQAKDLYNWYVLLL